MENRELIAAILAAGVLSQKSSMSPEKAVDEAIAAYSQINVRLVQLEANKRALRIEHLAFDEMTSLAERLRLELEAIARK
jgi:hypothetical protein